MAKGNRITLSNETKNELAELAKPFETPDECINRLLSCNCVKEEMKEENEKSLEEDNDK